MMKRDNEIMAISIVMVMLLSGFSNLYGQEWVTILTWSELLESFHPDEIPEAELEALQERATEIALNPLNINTEQAAELADIGLISAFQYNKLREYRFMYGDLLSLKELRYIEGWDENLYSQILPFLKPLDSSSVSTMKSVHKSPAHSELMLSLGRQLEKSKGYYTTEVDDDLHYLGSPWKYGLRYSLAAGKNIAAGIRTEKDPGEIFWPYHSEYPLSMNYPDHLSGYFSFQFPKFIRKLVLGDYHLQFGRGISLSSRGGFNYWKNPFGQNAAHTILRENTSMAEWGYFRGMALQADVKNTSVCIFFSSRKTDPSGYRADSDNASFTSISTSGYHRTKSEMARRGILDITAFGGIATYRNKRLKCGVAVYHTMLSIPKKPADRTYNKFDYEGNRMTIAGAFLDVFFRKSIAYLEVSYFISDGISFLSGWQANLNQFFKFSIDIRHFPVGSHHGLFTRGAGPYGSLTNESGILIGCELGLPKYWTVTMAMDYACNPWFSYYASSINNRHAFHSRVQRKMNDLCLIASYTYRQYDQDDNEVFHFTPPSRLIKKHHLDIQLHIFQGKNLRHKTRFSHLIRKDGMIATSSGSVLQHEITCAVPRVSMRFSLGSFLFNTDDYSSRVYLYEPNVLYSSGSIVLYGRGLRTYFLVKFSPLPILDLWLKAGMTMFEDKVSIGSGWDEIEGNKKTSVHTQLRLKI
jgi:hypothetical protein